MAANDINLDDIYYVDGDSWYQVSPYSFQCTLYDGTFLFAKEIFLPINPSDLTVTTHMATNVTATFTSVVEEHSNIKFYEITIRGTTGMSPKYVEMYDKNIIKFGNSIDFDNMLRIATDAPPDQLPGRESYTYDPSIFGGFFQKTEGAYNAIQEQFASGIKTGVYNDRNGYIAFHNLYRFFLHYKQSVMEKSADPYSNEKICPMIFVNRKDGIKYDVVPRTFSLTRNESSPLLYNYNIVLTGYNLRDANLNMDVETDEKRLAALGLGDNASLLSTISKYTKKATTVVKALKSGIRGFGS